MSQPNPSNQEELQNQVSQLYSQYQSAVRQLQIYEQQEAQIEGVIAEMNANLSTIKGLKDFPDNNEIIIPLGGMVMLKANLSGIKEVLVDIGSNVVVPSNLDEAERMLNERKEELIELLKRMLGEKQNLENIVNNLQAQLSQYS